jgi:hypothetical protein
MESGSSCSGSARTLVRSISGRRRHRASAHCGPASCSSSSCMHRETSSSAAASLPTRMRYPRSLAWEAFREANGARSAREIRSRIARYRKADPGDRSDFEVDCRILTQPFFSRSEIGSGCLGVGRPTSCLSRPTTRVVRPKHLQCYLDEFFFRFNRRKAIAISHGFARLIQHAASRRAAQSLVGIMIAQSNARRSFDASLVGGARAFSNAQAPRSRYMTIFQLDRAVYRKPRGQQPQREWAQRERSGTWAHHGQ